MVSPDIKRLVPVLGSFSSFDGDSVMMRLLFVSLVSDMTST